MVIQIAPSIISRFCKIGKEELFNGKGGGLTILMLWMLILYLILPLVLQ